MNSNHKIIALLYKWVVTIVYQPNESIFKLMFRTRLARYQLYLGGKGTLSYHEVGKHLRQ